MAFEAACSDFTATAPIKFRNTIATGIHLKSSIIPTSILIFKSPTKLVANARPRNLHPSQRDHRDGGDDNATSATPGGIAPD
jgi:hypothetical protein